MEEVTVVVGVDKSEQSMVACEWACKHLRSLSSNSSVSVSSDIDAEPCCFGIEKDKVYKVILLHVEAHPCLYAGPAYILGSEAVRLLDEDVKRTTEAVMKRALKICRRYNVEASTHVAVGDDPKTIICNVASKLGAHFLVLGTHGRGFLLRTLRGSVSTYCSKNAQCHVILVNGKEC